MAVIANEFAATGARSLPSQAKWLRKLRRVKQPSRYFLEEAGLKFSCFAPTGHNPYGTGKAERLGQDLLLFGAHFLAEATDLALAEMDALLVRAALFRAVTFDQPAL